MNYLERKCGLWPLLLVLILVGSPATVPAADFYQTQVPAPAGDDESQRQRALAMALQNVVRQVTGDPEAAASPRLKPEYDAAGSLAKSYRFTDSSKGPVLVAEFDALAVNAMLKRYGLSPRVDRPSVLVWMAGASTEEDRMLTVETDAEIWAALERAAVRGGVTMLQPLMDWQDQVSLPVADVSARVAPSIRQASVRYLPNAAASGYLMRGSGVWQTDWMLVSGDTVRRWSTRGKDLDGVLEAGMTDVVGMLASLFPVTPREPVDLSLPADGSQAPVRPAAVDQAPAARPVPPPAAVPEGQFLVRVAGINGAADYSRVMAVFRDNPAIAGHRMVASEPQAFVISVTPSTDQQAVAAALEAEPSLDAEPSGASAAVGSGISFYYRLKP